MFCNQKQLMLLAMHHEIFYFEKHAKYCGAQNLSADFAQANNELGYEELHVRQNQRYVFSLINEIN